LGKIIKTTHKEILKNCDMFYKDKAVAERMCYATKNCHAISTGCVDGEGGSLCSGSFNLRVKCGFLKNGQRPKPSSNMNDSPDVWGLYEKHQDADPASYIAGKQTYQMVCEDKPQPHTFQNCDSDQSAGPPVLS